MREEQPASYASGEQHIPPLGYAVGQLHDIYILAQNADGLVVVDMHAAHERIMYEKMKAARAQSHGIQQQRLLVPLTIDVSPAEAELAAAESRRAGALGLELDRSGPASLIVRGVPALLASIGRCGPRHGCSGRSRATARRSGCTNTKTTCWQRWRATGRCARHRG